MPSLNTIKTLTVRGQSQGLDRIEADLNKVGAAQKKVAQSGEEMARTTETSARRQLSAAGSFDKLNQRLDRFAWLAAQQAKDMAVVNRAFEQGAIDAERHAQAIGLVEVKYRDLVEAEERARAAAQGLTIANDNMVKSARESASVFEAAAREAEAYSARVAAAKAQIDPIAAAQDKFNAELAEFTAMAQRGDLSADELARGQTMLKARLEQTTAALNTQAGAMSRAAGANNNALGSTANIAAQFQDIGVTAAMGMSPIMIALQQGTQLSAVLNTMQNPIRGLATAFMSIINPVSLLTIGFIALGAAAIQWFMSAQKGAEDASTALERHDKWLDEVLTGYQEVRDAAQQAADAAAKLPEGVVASDLEASLRKQDDELQRLGRSASELHDRFAAMVEVMRATDRAAPSAPIFGGDLVQQVELLRDLNLSVNSTAQELENAATAARVLYNSTDDPAIKEMADEVFQLARGLTTVQGVMGSTEAALGTLNAEFTDLSGMLSFEQIANDTSLGLSLVERAAIAAAWAIANSGGAAAVAAGQYGTATGAANAYANAMFRLGSLIPEVAAAQAQFGQLKQAEGDYSAAIRENQALLDARGISLDEFARRQQAANDLYKRAQDQVTGLTDATGALAEAERQAQIGNMGDREAAAARITDRYAELRKQLEASGASEVEMTRATAAMNQELAASGRSFEQVAAKSGGAAKALKAAEKDFESFTGTADKLAEKLFPAEYARREAEELMSFLDKYRDKLDSFQIQGVEAEIANLNTAADQGLRRLEDRAKQTGDALTDTLGKVLGSLFDGPMDDIDAFFDKAVGAFAQLGEQNLGKFFEGFGSPSAANDNAGGSTNIFEAIFQGSKAGTEEGAGKGLFAGLKGLQGLSGAAGAGLGGFGMGMQTQSPMMGALGGAMSGFAVGGPIGGLVGGVMGFIGGMMGASKATKEAKEKLDQVRPSIEQFMDSMNGEVVSQYAKALGDANRQAEEYIALAKKAKDKNLVREIEAALANLPATLARQYEKDLQASVNALQGNSYLNDVAAAQELYNARLQDAEKLGADGSLALTELNLTLQKIADEANLSEAELARLAAIFPDIAPGLMGSLGTAGLDKAVADAQAAVDRARDDLRAAYDAEASALSQVIERNKQFIRSLEAFKQSLRFDTAISPLSPIDRLGAAERDFEATRQKALAGDQEAIGELENVSRQYLEEARAYYGTSESYMRIWEQVDATLDQALARAGAQVSASERQLGLLNSQVGHLIDINNSVMSVAAAVAALELANKQLAGAEQNRTDTLVDRLYSNVLGREADNAGAAWWGKIIQQQGGLTSDIYRQFADRARQNGEVTMPGYVQGGFTGGVEGQIAGYVHGQEYVANAPATRMFRPQLEAMNRGVAPSNDNGAMLSELRALRGEVAQLRGTVAAGAQATVEAVGTVSSTAAKGNRDSNLARLQRKAS
ncbi:phage tail length tape measure family protein [Devosia sp. 1635]|uniref:phage tail length tape measure family protein n=1 Tax=Devosia sp. 1635 TaxID=2726066 RepID=UPI0015637599|nr:phage tail length tape measure family protein [Devosia sp. 1635]